LYSGTPTQTNTWNNNTTLLEKDDWSYARCNLTTGVSGCANPGALGSTAAGPQSFVLTGTTDGTPGGTDLHTYFSTQVAQENPAASTYRLVQRNSAGGVTHDDAVPVDTLESEHGCTSQGPSTGSVEYTIANAQNTVKFEFWNGEPPAGTTTCVAPGCLYWRAIGGNPQITQGRAAPALTSPVDFTSAPGADQHPALSPDGSLLAWTT